MMRRKKNRIVILGLLLFLSNNILKAQNMNIEIDTLSDIIVKMKLPLNYKKNTYHYEEGTFIDFYYPNGAIISLFKGALHNTPLYSNDPQCILLSTDTIGNRIFHDGRIYNEVWHESKLKNLHVLYTNVPTTEKEQFDKSIESVSVIENK